MNITTIRNRILQQLYKPRKGKIINKETQKALDEMDKLIEQSISAVMGKKRGKARPRTAPKVIRHDEPKEEAAVGSPEVDVSALTETETNTEAAALTAHDTVSTEPMPTTKSD